MPDDFGNFDEEFIRRMRRSLPLTSNRSGDYRLRGALSFPRGGELSLVEIRAPVRPEVLAQGIMSGDVEKTELAREAILSGCGNGLLFALRNLSSPNLNSNVGEFALSTLKALDGKGSPTTLGYLLVLLALHKPMSLSGMSSMVFGDSHKASVGFEILLSLRDLVRGMP